MGKCLITKLNGKVDNTSLLKVGEMRIGINKIESPTKETQEFTINSISSTVARIVGDGFFTDETLTQNKGKEFRISKNTDNILYVSNTDCELAIENKYQFTKFLFGLFKTNTISNKVINIDSFAYSPLVTSLRVDGEKTSGNIASIKNMTKLADISAAHAADIFGDISVFKNLNSLRYIYLTDASVSGDIAAFKDLTSLMNVTLESKLITGDIAAFKDKTELSKLYLIAGNLTGTIESLKDTKLTESYFTNTNFTGDFATLPDNFAFISFKGTCNNTFTWGSRSTSAKIIAIEGAPRFADVDAMLQGQAQCTTNITIASAYWLKTITATGTRTSASDEAVATLQSKGYTVSITPAQ